MKRSSGNKIQEVDVSSDDESARDQPAKKNVKKEAEPAPSQQVLELQQKVAKLEEEQQSAFRYAPQYELQLEEAKTRVKFLENLVDNKRVVLADGGEKEREDELQKKLAVTTAKLEEATKKEEKARDSALAKAHENVALMEEINSLNKTISTMHTDQHLQERVSTLTKQMEVERCKANDERARNHSWIDELERKLAQFEDAQQQLLMKEEQEEDIDETALDNLSMVPNIAISPIDPEVGQRMIDLKQDTLETRLIEMQLDESKKRVEFLENIIDEMPGAGDGGEKKLVEELHKKLTDLEGQRLRDRARIDDLTLKLAQYEDGHQQQQPPEDYSMEDMPFDDPYVDEQNDRTMRPDAAAAGSGEIESHSGLSIERLGVMPTQLKAEGGYQLRRKPKPVYAETKCKENGKKKRMKPCKESWANSMTTMEMARVQEWKKEMKNDDYVVRCEDGREETLSSMTDMTLVELRDMAGMSNNKSGKLIDRKRGFAKKLLGDQAAGGEGPLRIERISAQALEAHVGIDLDESPMEEHEEVEE